jgi:predicted SAM-dependent methyltransferase
MSEMPTAQEDSSGTKRALDEATTLFEAALGRAMEPAAKQALADRIKAGQHDAFALVVELLCSVEFNNHLLARAIDAHLYLIHRARHVMVRRLLPAANDIIDLGGINAPLVDMGYVHPFRRMTLVDLAPGDRHPMYREIAFAERGVAQVAVHEGDMTRLDAFPDASFDLAWSGQSIEHVDKSAGVRMCAEVFRVLRPGGMFCLDTPNRAVTAIHTRDVGGGFIHPEHKHEYRVAEMRQLLQETGFTVELERGICEMPSTRSKGQFDYRDFVLGNTIVLDAEDAYIMYFAARKPIIAE